jgi:DNA gyrase subunit A
VALVDIDEVIRIIRDSDNSAQAKERLMERFSLSEIQTQYILDTPLRRLTRFDRIELESERDRLTGEIDELTGILDSDSELRKLVSSELASVAKKFGTERRTVLLESGATAVASVPLEVADDPCRVLLSSTGLLARTANGDPLPEEEGGARAKHDLIVSQVAATARADVGVVTSYGRLLRLSVIDLPQLPDTHAAPNLAGGAPVAEFVSGLEADETVICLTSLDESSQGLALGTEQGVVKRVVPDYPANKDELEVITLKEGDRIVGAVELRTGEEDLVFITDDAQLLRYPAGQVRPQGRPAGGMAGIKLSENAKVIHFSAVDPARDAVVFSVAGSHGTLDDSVRSGKLTPFDQYPRKGRATGGVRCQRFLKGEDVLVLAWAGNAPVRAASANGTPAALPAPDPRRDGSGTALPATVEALAGAAL